MPQKNKSLVNPCIVTSKKFTPTTNSIENMLLAQSHAVYINAFKANNGIISRPMVKEAFKVYIINREHYFTKELETAKNYVHYSNHSLKFEADLAEKLRKCIMTYYLHKKLALARPSLNKRCCLKRSLCNVWSMINRHWKILSKDDPHVNGNPTEFQDDIEEDYKGNLISLYQGKGSVRSRKPGSLVVLSRMLFLLIFKNQDLPYHYDIKR